MRKLSVIVPIYADWDSLNVCIESLINYYSNQTWLEIYLVNDNGPEADFLEEKIQQKITGIQNFSYFRNKKNLGFIKNCNNAVFNIANADTDVLLLNSDTKVTENSIEAMRAVLYSEKNIGLVNPRSNNAGLFGGVSLSVPLDNRYYNQPEKSYSEYLKIKDSLPESIELPVASGFCMMIKREVIDKIGLLDEVYGNGYFDDNDISMRARDAGFLCFAANKSFIFHLGSKSFSDEYRIERSKINQKIFLSRFPDYLSFIQQFPETLTDHQTPTSSRLFQKIIHSGISLVKYAQINGYKNAIKKTFKILSHKISHPFTKHRENPLRLQIWSHEVSNTGAPIVLFDVVDQLKGKIDFENIVYKYPVGVAVNEELRRSLKEKGIDFQEAISFDTHFHNNEIVVLNSSVYPAWVYIKILHNLHTGNIKHLFFYIHEDNEKLAGILRGFRKSIAELLTEDKITIYVPSKNTARQWHKFFGSEKNIFVMSGRIVFREGMFEKRQKTDFDKIKFVTSGSCYGNKGQLSIELALISFYNTFFKKSPEKYRDFEINIIGLDKDIKNYYSRTITEAAPGLDGRINLYHHMSQSEAFDIFKDSNLTITYSLEESFSMVTVEGMAYGHPIIRSDNSGSEEQLKEGKNGWKVSTKDWYGLVLAFEDLLNKEKTSNQKLLDMSNESIKIAKANYNSKYKIVEDIEHFINQLN